MLPKCVKVPSKYVIAVTFGFPSADVSLFYIKPKCTSSSTFIQFSCTCSLQSTYAFPSACFLLHKYAIPIAYISHLYHTSHLNKVFYLNTPPHMCMLSHLAYALPICIHSTQLYMICYLYICIYKNLPFHTFFHLHTHFYLHICLLGWSRHDSIMVGL